VAGVTFEHVAKRFGNVSVIEDLNLGVKDQEFMVLVGPSGCGKSTALRMIAGLEEVSDGKISIGERVVNDLPPKNRDIAMVFQNYALYPHMTVRENLEFGLRVRKTPPAEMERLVQEAAQILEISNLLDRKPKQLSGGQRQRVALGRAIVRKPAVFLFDEPLSNLDAKLRRRVRQEIRELQQSLELTVIYVTHDQEEALAVSDQVIVMDAGRIAQQGTPTALYEAPASRFLADFIGDANLVNGELVRDSHATYFSAGDVRVRVDADGVAAGPATLAVRPHRLRLVAAGDGVLAAECLRAAYLGSRIEYVLGTPWGELLVFDADVRKPIARGDRAGVAFAPNDVIVLPGTSGSEQQVIP